MSLMDSITAITWVSLFGEVLHRSRDRESCRIVVASIRGATIKFKHGVANKNGHVADPRQYRHAVRLQEWRPIRDLIDD
ncbi:hypothetical protein ElyMa_000210700 [Elysia marginata]|uniref:Uncharacterized protein n=1 Tax=Elysia marginata TaxID=1093978 RepID=A0AAV4EXJ7_9GAST|nr:hypothetical protein ElyMa_000210700 [Elysia marginata]